MHIPRALRTLAAVLLGSALILTTSLPRVSAAIYDDGKVRLEAVGKVVHGTQCASPTYGITLYNEATYYD